jgi:Tfp pilus assembly protein PilF
MTKLTAMLEKDATDPFLLFAMGMEHKKLKQTAEAVQWFNKTIERDPGYCVAYHQAALAYEDAGDVESAKRTYHEGIDVARKKGDHHAADEMAAALSMIE